MDSWIRDRYHDLRAALRRPGAEVDDEIAHHIAMRVRDNLAAGMSESEARAEAARRFGDENRIRRETRQVYSRFERRRRLRDLVATATSDLILVVRGLARRPGPALFIVLTLAAGMGASAAVFTVLDRVVLRPLPYPESGQLVQVQSRVPYVGAEARWGVSPAGYHEFRDHNRVFTAAGAMVTGGGTLGTADGPERIRVASITASLIPALGAGVSLGRAIGAADDEPGASGVVVLGHAFWRQRFGADSGIVGRTVLLNGAVQEVVGVMAPGVNLPNAEVDVWRALQLNPAAPPVNAHWLSVVGRMRPGVTVEAAQEDLTRLTGHFGERFPGAYTETFLRESGFSTEVLPLKQVVLGDVGRTLWILFGSVALLLAIAVANVANLYLVRAESRRRELAIRAALGAGAGRIVWLHLSESLVLALAASGPALLIAWAGIGPLLALSPSTLPRIAEVAAGGATIAFTAAITILAGVLLGLLPLAFRLVDLRALREGGRGMAGGGRQGVRRAMVTAQVALALVLLAAAGLMLQSLVRLRGVAPGFESRSLATFTVPLPFSAYGSYASVVAFQRRFQERLRALPGVEGVGATTHLPLVSGGGCAAVWVEDRPDEPGSQPPCVPVALASPGFFEAMRIPARGALPSWADVESGSGAAVVTAALARRLWPGVDPIGKGIRGNGWARPFYRVVAVTGDVRSEGLDRPPLEAVFFPMQPIEGAPLWSPPRTMSVVVRASVDEAGLMAGVRRILGELDAQVPLVDVQTMEDAIARSPAVARATFTLVLLGVAGTMSLLLSAIGLYGVISYLVAQRASEMGVRIALGASRRQVVGLVLGQSMRLVLLGVVLGAGAAVLLTRSLRALLFDVRPGDPATLAGAAAVLLTVAAVATLIPALRAASVDPREVLQAE